MSSPWMTSKRYHFLERVWHKTRSSLDRLRNSKQCHLCNRHDKSKIRIFYKYGINNAENTHQLWSCINKKFIDGPFLPIHNSLHSLCDVFSSYFKDKITLKQSSSPVHILNKVNVQPQHINYLLSSFTPAAVEEVRQIIVFSK